MKIYLVKPVNTIEPWMKNSGEIILNDINLEQRIKNQFPSHALELDLKEAESQMGMELEERVICFYNTFLSDQLVKKFFSMAHKKKKSFQCFVKKRATLIFTSEEDQGEIALPLYYIKSGESIHDCHPEILEEADVYQLATGLPQSIMQKKNTIIPFNTMVGIQVNDWSELLLASSLYAREFIIKQLFKMSPYLWKSLIHYLAELPFIAKKIKKIGKNCQIHPTAIIEGSIIGDNVVIGAHSYIRASVIGNNTHIRERSSVILSVIGQGNFITTSNIFNVLMGNDCLMFTQLLVNCVLGSRNFIGGGSGFSDFEFYRQMATMDYKGEKKETLHQFLASATGDDCYVGAGLIFKPGKMLPNKSHFLNKNMIDEIPSKEGLTFIANQGKLTVIPQAFLRG